MTRRTRQMPLTLVRTFACLLIISFGSVCTAAANDHPEPSHAAFSVWSPPLKFFQKVISRADGERCPMHPSCSHYAGQAFERHGALMGWILTCDRLLRCGHDELRLSPKVIVNGGPRTFDPVDANTRWWKKP